MTEPKVSKHDRRGKEEKGTSTEDLAETIVVDEKKGVSQSVF